MHTNVVGFVTQKAAGQKFRLQEKEQSPSHLLSKPAIGHPWLATWRKVRLANTRLYKQNAIYRSWEWDKRSNLGTGARLGAIVVFALIELA